MDPYPKIGSSKTENPRLAKLDFDSKKMTSKMVRPWKVWYMWYKLRVGYKVLTLAENDGEGRV